MKSARYTIASAVGGHLKGRLLRPIAHWLQIEDLRSLMNQFAAKRNAQELSIRYVSGPRNHF